jgi:hypothetical protein
MGLLKVQKIESTIIATNGKDQYMGIIMCTKDENPAKYICTILEDNQMPKEMMFALCEDCYQEMVKSCNMHRMSLN